MKKILTLLVVVFTMASIHAQYSPGVDKIAEQDLNILETQFTSKYPNLAFSPSQKVQVAAVLKDRAQEIHTLRIKKDVSKYDYTIQHQKIVEKHNSKLKSVLSDEQKAVYFKEPSPVTNPRAEK